MKQYVDRYVDVGFVGHDTSKKAKMCLAIKVKGFVILTVCIVLLHVTASRCCSDPANVTSSDPMIALPGQINSISDCYLTLTRSGVHVIGASCDDAEIASALNTALAGKSFPESVVALAIENLAGLIPVYSPQAEVFEGPPITLSGHPSRSSISDLGLQLVCSFTPAQISEMYSAGFATCGWLQPNQRQLFADLITKSEVYQVYGPDQSFTAIMAYPVKFTFNCTASVRLIADGGEYTPWQGLFDYGFGIIPAPVSTDTSNESSHEQVHQVILATYNSPIVTSSSAGLHIPYSGYYSLDDISRLGKTAGWQIFVDKRLQGTEVFISAGTYTNGVLNLIADATGTEDRTVGDLNYFGLMQTPGVDETARKANIAVKILQKLPLPASFPFPPSAFSASVTLPFSSMSAAQQNYVRAHVNVIALDGEHIDLLHAKVELANTIWLEGYYYGPAKYQGFMYQIH